jgi:hypothetical protein
MANFLTRIFQRNTPPSAAGDDAQLANVDLQNAAEPGASNSPRGGTHDIWASPTIESINSAETEFALAAQLEEPAAGHVEYGYDLKINKKVSPPGEPDELASPDTAGDASPASAEMRKDGTITIQGKDILSVQGDPEEGNGLLLDISDPANPSSDAPAASEVADLEALLIAASGADVVDNNETITIGSNRTETPAAHIPEASSTVRTAGGDEPLDPDSAALAAQPEEPAASHVEYGYDLKKNVKVSPPAEPDELASPGHKSALEGQEIRKDITVEVFDQAHGASSPSAAAGSMDANRLGNTNLEGDQSDQTQFEIQLATSELSIAESVRSQAESQLGQPERLDAMADPAAVAVPTDQASLNFEEIKIKISYSESQANADDADSSPYGQLHDQAPGDPTPPDGLASSGDASDAAKTPGKVEYTWKIEEGVKAGAEDVYGSDDLAPAQPDDVAKYESEDNPQDDGLGDIINHPLPSSHDNDGGGTRPFELFGIHGQDADGADNLRFEMKDVPVTSYQISGSSADADSTPTELAAGEPDDESYLLLPAVQKVREAAARMESSSEEEPGPVLAADEPDDSEPALNAYLRLSGDTQADEETTLTALTMNTGDGEPQPHIPQPAIDDRSWDDQDVDFDEYLTEPEI